jgi:hypothetical protein
MVKAGDVPNVRMTRMGLIGTSSTRPVDVVQHHLAMQAQDFGPAKWAIGQRLQGLVDKDVERKISDGQILRTHVLRPTWHFVGRRDLRWLMVLSGPRVQKTIEARYRQLNLDVKTRSRAEKVVAAELVGGNHLTRRELTEIFHRSRIAPDGQRMPHLLMHCELQSVICSGRVRGKEQTYALFDERVPKGRDFDREGAVEKLVRRYLESHGPASLKDMAWWSGLTIRDLRSGLDSLGARAISEKIEGTTLWWSGDQPPSHIKNPHVQLLQTYDEFVVGYSESRYLGDPRAARIRKLFTDRNLPNGTVMLGARVAGHWRRTITAKTVNVQVLLYEPLKGAARVALESAVEGLAGFLGRQPELVVGAL